MVYTRKVAIHTSCSCATFTCISNSVSVTVLLVWVMLVYAVVAHIAHPITVCVILVWIIHCGTVVVLVLYIEYELEGVQSKCIPTTPRTTHIFKENELP